jgi:hypothetical protein
MVCFGSLLLLLLLAKTPLGQQIEQAEKLLKRLETLEASEDLVSMI